MTTIVEDEEAVCVCPVPEIQKLSSHPLIRRLMFSSGNLINDTVVVVAPLESVSQSFYLVLHIKVIFSPIGEEDPDLVLLLGLAGW